MPKSIKKNILCQRVLLLSIGCLCFYYNIMAQGFDITYYKPVNKNHQRLFKTLYKNDANFYGDAVKFLNALYQLPREIKIVVADCGSRNSRYNYDEATIYICYESLQYKVDDYRNPPTNDKDYRNRVFKNSVFTFWHEVGHAMIHQLGLPTNSDGLNEEDLADEFAVLSMIWRQDEKWTNAIVTSSLHYKNKTIRRKNKGLNAPDYEYHSPNIERYYNMNCLLYGMKPISFERLEKRLEAHPKGSTHCKSYYETRNAYWSNLLKTYTKYDYF